MLFELRNGLCTELGWKFEHWVSGGILGRQKYQYDLDDIHMEYELLFVPNNFWCIFFSIKTGRCQMVSILR